MSRQAAVWLIALAYLSSGPAAVAQASDDSPVNVMITQERKSFGAPQPRRQRCVKGNGDEITVCAPDRGEDLRVPSSTESDPGSREALRDGRAHAPELGPPYCAKCPHFGKVPEPIYYFDIKALPEAPEGSDAGKIASGEADAP